MIARKVVPVVLVAMVIAACGGEPEEPVPSGPTQAQLDSIRRAEEEAARRRAEEERRRREEAERARAAEAAAARAREVLQQRIHFDYDRSNIRTDAERVLMRKVEILRANPAVRLRIAGHADERGSLEYNQALGMRRAEAAKQFLTGFGISAARLETVSFGEGRPLVNASNEEAWAMNRRDEFTIIAGGDQLTAPGQ